MIFGIVSLQRLPIREYPDIERPVISIATNYSGASSPVIETKISQPIEDSISGIEASSRSNRTARTSAPKSESSST